MVIDKAGNLFEDRRKQDKKVETDRRKQDINKSKTIKKK